MKFDVNRIMDAIMILTESYVSNIDDIAIQEKTRLDQVEETIRRHDGQWTKEYCDQYRREHGTDRAANIRELTEAESEKVKKIVEAGKISDSALQNAIDGADPDVKMLIGMSDFGDRLKVIA